MLLGILLLFIVVGVRGDCCRECTASTDQGCSKCSQGFLTLGLCTELCPSGYEPSGGACIKVSKIIFSLEFLTPISLSGNKILNWRTGDDSEFFNPEGSAPLPTLDRGFYFKHQSALISEDQLQPGPISSIELWVHPFEQGQILESFTHHIAFYHDFISVKIRFKLQEEQMLTEGQLLIPALQGWNYLIVNVYQSSATSVTMRSGSIGQTIEDCESSYDTSHWNIGGFSGFLYFVSVSNELKETITKLWIPLCKPQEYWNGGECRQCSQECAEWPWCRRGTDCSICVEADCYCDGYTKEFITGCSRKRSNQIISTGVLFNNVIGLLTCPTMYTEDSSTNCILSDQAKLTVTFYNATASTFQDPTGYFAFKEQVPMVNAYLRGAYFDGASTSMQTTTTFQFSPVSAYMFWFNSFNTAGEIFSKYVNGVQIFAFKNNNGYSSLSIAVGDIIKSAIIKTYYWYAVLITIQVELLDAPTYTLSMYNNANIVLTGSTPILDSPTTETYLAHDKLFQGYFYEFSYWPYVDSTITFANNIIACSTCTSCSYQAVSLGDCLVNCALNYYDINGVCSPCLSECTTCRSGTTCALNTDPLCVIYSDYNICLSCKDFTLLGSSNGIDYTCNCISAFFLQISDNTCCSNLCMTCSGNGVFCSSCLTTSVDSICLSICPTLYQSSNTACFLYDLDSSIIWNLDVTTNFAYDTSAYPYVNIGGTNQGGSDNFNPFLNPTSDPIPGKKRGLYFNGQTSLSTNSFTLSPVHSIIIWFNPLSSPSTYYSLINKDSTIFGIDYFPGQISITFSMLMVTVVVKCQIDTALNTWFMLALTSHFEPNSTYVNCNINDLALYTYTSFPDNYFIDTASGTISLGYNSFHGWIYEMRYYVIYISPDQLIDQYNSNGGPASLSGSFSYCGPFEYEDSAGNCQPCYSTECIACINGNNCEVCNNVLCYSCYDFYTDRDCTMCPDGSHFVDPIAGGFVSGVDYCILCIAQCFTCWSGRIDACSVCNIGYFMNIEGVCLPYCPTGLQTVSNVCVNAYSQEIIASFKFIRLTNVMNDLVNNLPMYMGDTSAFYPNYEITDPLVRTYRGLYFTGTSYATLGSQPSSPVSLFLGNSHSFDLWVSPVSFSGDGTILSIASHTQICIQLYVVSYTQNYNYVLNYTLASTSNTALFTTYPSLTPYYNFNKWKRVTWIFSFASRLSNINLYIDTNLVSTLSLQDCIYYESQTTLLLGTLSSVFYTGFLYSLDIYNIIYLFPGLQRSSCGCPVCTASGDCLISCGINQYFLNGACVDCQSTCTNGCARGDSCSLHPDPLCVSYTVLQLDLCDVCAQNALHIDTCQCIKNALYSSALSYCQCNTGCELVDGACQLCSRWIQASEIVAAYDSSYIQIFFTFAMPVSETKLSCDGIFTSTSTKLFGNGYMCSFSSDGTVMVLALGENAQFVEGNIEIQAGVLSSIANICGFNQKAIQVVVSINEVIPYPVAVIDAPSVVLYECQNLTISGLKSTGSLHRYLLYKWNLSSVPDNTVVDSFSADYQPNIVNFTIPGSSLFNSTIDVALSVKNIFGNVNTAHMYIVSISSIYALQVYYDTSINHVLTASKGATVIIHGSSCNTIQSVKVIWSILNITNNSTAVNEDLLWGAQKSLDLFIIPKNAVPANSLITFQAVMQDSTSLSQGFLTVPLLALQDQPDIIVDIANGTYFIGNPLTINASLTYDPNSIYNLTYLWTCQSSGNVICDNMIINPTSSVLTVNNNLLVVGTQYFFTLLVEKYQSTSNLGALSLRTFALSIVNSAVPRVNIYNGINKQQPEFIVNNLPLILEADITGSSLNYSYNWTAITESSFNLLSPSNLPSLTIDGASLLPREYYYFQLTVTGNGVSGIYSYEFTVNSPPHLGTVMVSPTIGYEFDTVFRIDALNFIDDEGNYPLTYAFGYIDNNIEHLLHLKNQSFTYYTEFPYTGGYTQVLVRVYDSFDCYASYIYPITVSLNSWYDQRSLLDSVIQDAGSAFYDIQTTAGTLSLLSSAILNREYTVNRQFTLQIGSQAQLLQDTYTYCMNQTLLMLSNITFYDYQGAEAMSTALQFVSINPNLQTASNLVVMINVINQVVTQSSNSYGLSSNVSSNFLMALVNLAPLNSTFMYVDPASAEIFIKAIDIIEINSVKSMGLGQNTSLSIGNATADFSVILTTALNNFTIFSTSYPDGYVTFPANITSYLRLNTTTVAVCLTIIPQNAITHFVPNQNDTRPTLVNIDIIDKFTLEIVSAQLGDSYIIISIPIEGPPLNYTPDCLFLDTINHIWSTSGCYLVSIEADSAICACNHLSLFSISDFFNSGKDAVTNNNLERSLT